MGLIGSLRAMANRLGIVRIVSLTDGPNRPTKITTRAVTLKDLMSEVHARDVRALAELPAELSVPFSDVFTAAKITLAPHGWGVERLRGVLETEQYRSMPREAAQKAILGQLSADKAPSEDIVKDAIARDQHIDAFAKFVYEKMGSRHAARARRRQEIEVQIAALRKEADDLTAEDRSDQQHWADWWQKKVAFEKGIAEAVSYLLDKPVVTIDEKMPTDHNSA